MQGRVLGWLAPAAALASVSVVLGACAPSLDWRQVRPEGAAVEAMFPCRPGRHERELTLGGQRVRLTLLSCSASDMTFALSFLQVAQAEQIGPMLDALRVSVAENLAGESSAIAPLAVPGMTPSPQALTMQVQGRRPDGQPVHATVAVFSNGPQLFQAQVLGAHPDLDAAQTFVVGLRVGSR